MHTDDGSCLSCLLNEGLAAESEASAQVFASALAEADVPDRQWHLGNYEILEEIGRGGMGVIYRARQRHSRRIVAVKRVLTYHADSHETLARFRREAEAAASLDHPNILPIYEVTEEGGLPFFSMKLATGGSLRAAAPDSREAVQLMAKVARAVDYAHGQRILHRDLQPGNILLDARGEPMVSDFGLARWLDDEIDLTRTLTTFGTPGFIAPEQVEGTSFSPASDIYSLGAILFNLLAGRPPFIGANALTVIRQAELAAAPKLRSITPTLSRDLETIVARCLERDPRARYPTAGALGDDLERWLEGRPIRARPLAPPARIWRWSQRNPILASVVAACFLLGGTVLWLLREHVASIPLATEKSIAVLPFQDLGESKETSDFASGIQDDVLTSLGQIHELKVISRSSVIAYQNTGGRNVREIGRALGVQNVLEGSVRRSEHHILVNVELIDARNDRHIWAERYDRAVADSLGLQGELATQIAAALKATLAPEEKARLRAEPTGNSAAYVSYLTGLGKEDEDQMAAERLYVEATTFDPKFALAYARASLLNSSIASQGERERKARARAQAEEALRLSPNLGEAHMALGLCLYWGEKNYEEALKEFELAVNHSPNNAEIHSYIGGIYRRQGRWRDAAASFNRARSLDPRSTHILLLAGNNHLYLRDWAAAADDYARAMEVSPNVIFSPVYLAYVEVFLHGDITAGEKILQNMSVRYQSDEVVILARWDMAMLQRDYPRAEKILNDSSFQSFPHRDAPKAFFQGRTALARGDNEVAQRYFEASLPILQDSAHNDPDNSETHSVLGILYGYMRRKEDAIREGQLAVALQPETQDAFHGAYEMANLALIYSLVGEKDQAISLIERLLATPGPMWPDHPANMTLADLRLRWEWDQLRGNPRFDKIVAMPEPRTIY